MLTTALRLLFKFLFFLKLDLVVFQIVLNSGQFFRKVNHNNKKCIVINRSIFQEDMKVLESQNTDINFVYIHKMYFQAIFECFFKKSKINEKNFYNIKDKNKILALKNKYLKLLKFFYSNNFQYISSGNFNYVELFELFKICNVTDIKILIVYKEGFGVKKDILEEFFNKYTKFDFKIDLITFSNNIIRDCAISKINIVTDENSKVIGIPRMEKLQRSNRITNTILLFSSYPYDKVTLAGKKFFNKKEIDEIFKNMELMHYYFFKVALKNPKKKFIIKTKSHKKYLSYVNGIKKKYFNNYKFTNLTITTKNFNGRILEKVDTVISWGSTTVLEAIFCNKKVLVPNFNDKIHKEFNLIYKNEEEMKMIKNYFEYKTYSEFKRSLESHIVVGGISTNKTIENNIPNFNKNFNYNLRDFF